MRSGSYLDQAPTGLGLSDYDREHMVLYLRLLDADAAGADWREIVAVLFDIDPIADIERARRMHHSHLERARWLSREGYRHLLREG
jgi:hypothetical protein